MAFRMTFNIDMDNNININTAQEKQEETERIILEFITARNWVESLKENIIDDSYILYDRNNNDVGYVRIIEECEHEYSTHNRCGASVCVWCDNHLSLDMEQQLARCFCGWSRSGGNGYQEMLEMGETI